MRKSVLAASLAACMGAQAQEPVDLGAASMFYISKPFGAGSSQDRQPSLGMRMSMHNDGRGLLDARSSLVDMRFQQQGLQEMRLNGVSFMTRDKLTNELTIGGEEVSPEVLIGGAIFLGVGVSCVTDNWPCEDNTPALPPPG